MIVPLDCGSVTQSWDNCTCVPPSPLYFDFAQHFMYPIQAPQFLKSKKFQPLQTVIEIVNSDLTPIEMKIVTRALKKSSYYSRLFSAESWGEWCEHRTPLGKFIDLEKEYRQSPSESLLKRSKPLRVQANEDAKELLNNLQKPFVGKLKAIKECNTSLAMLNMTEAIEAFIFFKGNFKINVKSECCEVMLRNSQFFNRAASIPTERCSSKPPTLIVIASGMLFSFFFMVKTQDQPDELDESDLPKTVSLMIDRKYLICSLTGKEMTDPVLLPNGELADRSALFSDSFLKELIRMMKEDKITIDSMNFICPITHCLMKDPVRLPDGRRCEREAIQNFYNIGGRRCPETETMLPNPKTLKTDALFKELLKQLKQQI